MLRRAFRSHPLFSLLALAVFLSPSVLFAATSSLDFTTAGTNGQGVTDSGLACADGSEGASQWRYEYGGSVPSGAFSSAATTLGLHLDLRSDSPGSPPAGGAWLGPDASVLLSNSRGTLGLDLESGACGSPTLTFDGTTATGSGDWSVTDGTGSYRQATGVGTFNLVAQVGPGADNTFSITLSGDVTVHNPSLRLQSVRASWVPPPLNSNHRFADVTYEVINDGPGDSYGVELLDASTTTEGVALVGPVPQSLGDLAAGESALVTVRYQFDRGPCAIIDQGCAFDADLSVLMPDALDNELTFEQTLRVRVPTPPQH